VWPSSDTPKCTLVDVSLADGESPLTDEAEPLAGVSTSKRLERSKDGVTDPGRCIGGSSGREAAFSDPGKNHGILCHTTAGL